MLPSSVAKTWLCQGLVNTDSIDWVETGAGGVRRKMIERPRKCLWSMMIVDGWMVVAHDGDDGRSDYEMCWRFLWSAVWLYDVEVRSAVQFEGICGRPLEPWDKDIHDYFGRRIEESCRYIQTIHTTHITWKSNIFLEAATFGHGPLLVRLKTIILLASQYKIYKETMHSSCVEFSLWVSG